MFTKLKRNNGLRVTVVTNPFENNGLGAPVFTKPGKNNGFGTPETQIRLNSHTYLYGRALKGLICVPRSAFVRITCLFCLLILS